MANKVNVEQAIEMLQLGFSEEDVKSLLGCSDIDFQKALKKSKELASALNNKMLQTQFEVMQSLKKLANGYEYTETDSYSDSNGKTSTTNKKRHQKAELAAIDRILTIAGVSTSQDQNIKITINGQDIVKV